MVESNEEMRPRLYVGFFSAVALYERFRLEGRRLNRIDSVMEDAVSGLRDLEKIDVDGLGLPMDGLDIMIPFGVTRHRFGSVKCHQALRPAGEGWFVEVESGPLVLASPELCLLQTACSLSDFEWLKLACRFCGRYALDSSSPAGTSPCEPLTSARRIAEFAERNSGMRGAKTVKRLAEFVLDDARSPKEAELAIALTLPYGMGGLGCPKPELNQRIAMNGRGRAITGSSALEIDLLWESASFGLEYIGRAAHEGKRERDAARDLAFDVHGIEVRDVTLRQLGSALAMEEFARLVGRKTGCYVRGSRLASLDKRQKMLNELLSRRVISVPVGSFEI